MIANLFHLFGNTEKYDNFTGSMIGLGSFLIGLLCTFSIYSVYLVDNTLDNQPRRKSERLKLIVVVGFTLSLLVSLFVGFSINKYYFCGSNPQICQIEYAISPFA